MKYRILLILVLAAVAINRACSLLPADVYFDPFPLYDMQINLQSYVYFICVHVSIILLWIDFRMMDEKVKDIFTTFIILEVVSLADFFIIYEHPWFHIGSYGVEFTDAKILLYTYYIIRWKP